MPVPPPPVVPPDTLFLTPNDPGTIGLIDGIGNWATIIQGSANVTSVTWFIQTPLGQPRTAPVVLPMLPDNSNGLNVPFRFSGDHLHVTTTNGGVADSLAVTVIGVAPGAPTSVLDSGPIVRAALAPAAPTPAGFNTFVLDSTTWDLVLDAQGNVAVAAPPYAVAQDVSSACRTFLGEIWYDTENGIAYHGEILGKFPPLSLLKKGLTDAASQVPGCFKPVCYFSSYTNRKLTGQVQFYDEAGGIQVAGF